MPLDVQNLQGAHALDIQTVLKAYRGYSVDYGMYVTSGTGDMEVDIAAGAFYTPLKSQTISATTLTLDTAVNNPRKDIIYVKPSDGSAAVYKGNEAAAQPSGQTKFNTFKPEPYDMHDEDAIILAEVWVSSDRSIIYGSDIRDRRLIASKLPINGAHSAQTRKDPFYHCAAYDIYGDGSTDMAGKIQGMFDEMNADGGGIAYFPPGTYYIDSTVYLKQWSTLLMSPNARFTAGPNIGDYDPTFAITEFCWVPNIRIDAQGGSGLLVGEANQPAEVFLGNVKVLTAGNSYDAGTNSAQFGLRFKGYNHAFNHLEIQGGNRGLDINAASDVYGKSVLVVQATTATSVEAAEHVYINQLDLDTNDYRGLSLGNSHDIHISADIWTNNTVDAAASLNEGVYINEYGTNYCSALNLDLTLINHGPSGLNMNHVEDSVIDVNITNSTLFTAGQTINTGITYGSNVEDSVTVRGNITGVSTPISGTPAGTIDIPNVGYNGGTHSDTGDGAVTTFDIPHGLAVTPTVTNVWPESEAASDNYWVSGKDGTNITLTYSTAPANGASLAWGFDARF